MAGLQRSAVSFRRQGSSGLIWDDRFLSGEVNKVNWGARVEEPEKVSNKKYADCAPAPGTAVPAIGTLQRSRSNDCGGGARGYRAGKVSTAVEPQSPKVSGCWFCSAFGKQGNKGRKKQSPAPKHRLR